jgi:hypothetical protein
MSRSTRAETARRAGAAPTPGRERVRTGRRRLAADERGTAIVEFAIVTPLLLMLVLGVIEYGNVFSNVHTLASLSREGANLASRGATLPVVVDNVMSSGADIALSGRGGVVASRLIVSGGVAKVDEQVSSTGYAGKSHVGAAKGPATGTGTWGLQEGQIVYVVELFYRYDTVTPLEAVVGIGVPDTLYERGIF